MKNYRKLITDEPQGNYQMLHNCTTIINREVHLKDFDAVINLVDYCKQECRNECGTDIDAGAEDFGEYMDCDCVVARFYHMAVGHAELRANLKQYEDSNISPEVVKQMAETIARNLVAWDTSKDNKQGLLPEVYLKNKWLYKEITGEEYYFDKACEKFHIGHEYL